MSLTEDVSFFFQILICIFHTFEKKKPKSKKVQQFNYRRKRRLSQFKQDPPSPTRWELVLVALLAHSNRQTARALEASARPFPLVFP